MRSSLLTLALAAAANAQSSTLLWQQHEDTAVYTAAGLSRHQGATPTFSTATWLNQPIFVEAYNVSDSGEFMWSYGSSNLQATFQVDMARHAETFGVGAIDTIAAEANFVPPSSCNLYAFNSLVSTGVPAWNFTYANCDSSLLYDSDRFVDISDDGSTVAFSGFTYQGQATTAQLWVFDAQTGKLRWQKSITAQGSGGPVQCSENGTWVAWTSGDSVIVYDGTTGATRDTIQMGWNTQAELSDSGDYLAFAGNDVGSIYAWNAANQQYTLKYSVVPPNGTWYSVSAAISSDGTGTAMGELVTYGWIDEDALTARATIYSMVTGALLTDYVSPKNAQLQTTPTVRMDGNYAALALWGDNDDVPTAIVLSAGVAKPVFTYTTPGSMFGVDIVVDRSASTPANDVVYFSVAGKHTPANVMGNGGDAYSWRINVPK